MENQLQSFASCFRMCCNEACGRLTMERGRTDPEHIAAKQHCEELYEQVKKQSDLLDDFDAAKNHVFSFAEEAVYQQGFQDCVYLLRWIGLL